MWCMQKLKIDINLSISKTKLYERFWSLYNFLCGPCRLFGSWFVRCFGIFVQIFEEVGFFPFFDHWKLTYSYAPYTFVCYWASIYPPNSIKICRNKNLKTFESWTFFKVFQLEYLIIQINFFLGTLWQVSWLFHVFSLTSF